MRPDDAVETFNVMLSMNQVLQPVAMDSTVVATEQNQIRLGGILMLR